MDTKTPGQAAYERWHTAGRRLIAVPWERLDKFDRMYWDEIASAAVAAEREACAELCELWNASHPERLAAAIRARGKP